MMRYALLVGGLCGVQSLHAAWQHPDGAYLRAGIEGIRNKVELHLHLGGSFPRRLYLATIATPAQLSELDEALEKVNSGMDYSEVFHVFPLVAQIVNTDQKVEDGTAALCESLKADGVSYVEIRTGLKNCGSGFKGYLDAVLRGIKRGSADRKIKVGLIVSLRRSTPIEEAEETIRLALAHHYRGVVGLDISGDSGIGDATHFMDLVVEARLRGLPLTLHIGESPKETEEQQMRELTILSPNRIGHGVHLHKKAMGWVLTNETPVECCLSSAVKVRMIEAIAQHPALTLFKRGHPVVFCTDNTLLFKTTVSNELFLAMSVLGLSARYCAVLQEKAYDYRF